MTVARERVLAEEEKKVGIRRTQNSPRAVVGTRDDGIFITTRFALGIILGTFSWELSVKEARALLREYSQELLPEMNSHDIITYFRYFFMLCCRSLM